MRCQTTIYKASIQVYSIAGALQMVAPARVTDTSHAACAVVCMEIQRQTYNAAGMQQVTYKVFLPPC